MTKTPLSRLPRPQTRDSVRALDRGDCPGPTRVTDEEGVAPKRMTLHVMRVFFVDISQGKASAMREPRK